MKLRPLISIAAIAAQTLLWNPPLTLWGSQGKGDPQEQPQQDRSQRSDEHEERRPTLGRPTEPSPGGPRTATTTDPRRLLRVHKIFVQSIDNSLSDRLISGLQKIERFHIVTTRNEADAVLAGTCLESHRLRSIHAEVYLNDRASGASIWQDTVRRPFNPPVLGKAVEDAAALILVHLSENLQEAQRGK